MIRLKFLAAVNPTLPQNRVPLPDNEVTFLPMEHIGKNGELDLSLVRPAKEISQGYTAMLDGDVVVAKITPCFENGKGALCTGLQGGVGFGTTELIVLRAKQHSNPRFIYWLTRSHEFRNWGEAEMTGSAGQKRVSAEFVSNFRTAGQSLLDQHRIAAYLDEQTAKIDRLMDMRRRQMALLKDQRAALIQQAVTRGIHPNAPMKDSGLPWLGEIPAHWNVIPVKYAARISRGRFGHRPRTDPALYDGPYPFVQTGDVATAKKYLSTYSQTLNEKGYSVSVEFPAGTLLMAIAANIGDLAILGINACLPDSIVGFFPYQGIDVEFLYYQLSCMQSRLHALAPENTQMNLNIDRLSPEKIVVPPYDDQKEICRFINEREAQIDSIRSSYVRQITLLAEYRASLIHECVTGQRPVPDRHTRVEVTSHAL